MNSQHIPPLVDAASALTAAGSAGCDIPAVIWDDTCPSTNDSLAEIVRGEVSLAEAAHGPGRQLSVAQGIDPAGPPSEFTICGTDHQTAGHGRLGRVWSVPPRKSLTFSILLSPDRVFDSWGWVPLLAGEAVRAAIADLGVDAQIKWPNDVLTPAGKKLCGILARVEPRPEGPRIILGMGVNTRLEPTDLPRPEASSIAIELGGPGTEIDHERLLVSIVSRLIPAYEELIHHGDDGFGESAAAAAVRANMVTLGARVRVERPDGTDFVGVATGLDSTGDLIIDDSTRISAGDVHHLRIAND